MMQDNTDIQKLQVLARLLGFPGRPSECTFQQNPWNPERFHYTAVDYGFESPDDGLTLAELIEFMSGR